MDLAFRTGKEIALEAKSKSADIMLAPTVNLIRSPLGKNCVPIYGADSEAQRPQVGETTRHILKTLTSWE